MTKNELHGVGLQEAKRRARESHPIAPQLDNVAYSYVKKDCPTSIRQRARVKVVYPRFAY